LNSIYINEYAVTLEPLKNKAKRQARQYLSELDGMAPFVCARVVLLALGGHAIPVDEALAGRLKRDGAADPDATIEEVQAFLEKQIRSAEAKQAHAALMAYVENTSAPGRAKSTGAGKRAGSSSRRNNGKTNARSNADTGKTAS
jgi:endonuclease III